MVEDHDLWHHRLGHPSPKVLDSIPDISFSKAPTDCCDICLLSKQSRLPFIANENKANAHFVLIHCDLWGSCKVSSFSGAWYFFTLLMILVAQRGHTY